MMWIGIAFLVGGLFGFGLCAALSINQTADDDMKDAWNRGFAEAMSQAAKIMRDDDIEELK